MATAETVKIRLKRSEIGGTDRQRRTLRGLGLRKIGDERELEKSNAVLGMIKKVAHLVEVEES
jgi:large subunit ribosomal protein L30